MPDVKVNLRDLVTGEDLTPDEPVAIPSEWTAEDLIKELFKADGGIRLPDQHVYSDGTVKIQNKTSGRELASDQRLEDIGTKDGDVLGISYEAVHGR